MGMLTWCHQDVDETSNRPGIAPPEGRAFSQVINGLQKSYPRDKMEEISTSFCFICLLHLANEQGLKIETSPCEMNGGDDNNIGRRVGDIWGLKVPFRLAVLTITKFTKSKQVYRDPTATPAA